MKGASPARLFPLRAGDWCTLDGNPASPPEGPPLVVTSVASPEGFREAVRARTKLLAGSLFFPDHHPYSTQDAGSIRSAAGGTWIATTEKDAVKLAALRELLPEVRVLPLVPDPPEGLEAELLGAIRERLQSGSQQ